MDKRFNSRGTASVRDPKNSNSSHKSTGKKQANYNSKGTASVRDPSNKQLVPVNGRKKAFSLQKQRRTRMVNDLVFMHMAFGMHAQSKELRFKSRQFIDFVGTEAAPVLKYAFGLLQESLGTADTGEKLTSTIRLNRVKVFSLPRSVNAANASSSYLALFGLPVAQADEGFPANQNLLAQRNTLVNPTFNVNWVLIGNADFDKLYRDTQYEPTVSESTPYGYNVFSLTFRDPDVNAKTKVITEPIQLCVEIDFTETLPIASTVKTGQLYEKAFLETGSPEIVSQLAMLTLEKITDKN